MSFHRTAVAPFETCHPCFIAFSLKSSGKIFALLAVISNKIFKSAIKQKKILTVKKF